jgi:hypothetical protein
METIVSSETSVDFKWPVRHYIAEDCNLQLFTVIIANTRSGKAVALGHECAQGTEVKKDPHVVDLSANRRLTLVGSKSRS